MLHYGNLNRWAGDAQRDPPWHSELNTARFCFGYATGYDSIRDLLTASDSKTIVESMVRLGILPILNDWVLPEKRIHALDSMGHNWWSVCVAMAGTASLAIVEDEPRAREWLARVKAGFPEWFAYQGNILQNKSPNFDRDGAFYESVNYANYALSEYLLFHLGWTNVFGQAKLPRIPALHCAGDFFVHTAYPTTDGILSVNFGDSSLHADGARTLRLLLANGFGAPEYHWYLTRTNPGPSDPIALVYDELQPTSTPPYHLPESKLYKDIGWAMMRASWEDDSTMLAVTSGFAWNHAHPDAGSFILFHGGKPLIIDSGNCSYSRREYSSYYRTSRAHNVILVDGEAENPEACGGPDRGVVHPGQVVHLMDTGDVKYVMADATGPTSWKFSRNYRHFLWIDGVILIFDDVRTHTAGQLEWLLHYAGTASFKSSGIHLENGDKAKAVVRSLHPRNLKLVRKEGLKDHAPDKKVEYLALSPPGKRRDEKFITAIIPEGNGSAARLPDIELLEGDEMLGVRIRNSSRITEVYLNLRADGRRMHRNSNKVINGWQTDAYIFGTTRTIDNADDPDAYDCGFVICGSYLRRDGEAVLDSLSKVYCIFQEDGDAMNVVLQGQPLVDCAMRASCKPKHLVVNGVPAEVVWNGQSQTVVVRLSD